MGSEFKDVACAHPVSTCSALFLISFGTEIVVRPFYCTSWELEPLYSKTLGFVELSERLYISWQLVL